MTYIAADPLKNYSELRVTVANVAAKRATAIQTIFHQATLPTDQMVFVSDEGSGASTYSFTTKGTVAGWNADWVYNIQRRDPTSGDEGKVFIYCLGHETAPLVDIASLSPYLRSRGYTVCFMYMPCISPNTGPYGDGDPGNSVTTYHPGLFKTLGNDAIQYFLYPLLAAVNFFEASGFAGKIMVCGHSGGTNAVRWLSALDTRILRSVLTCGTAPDYLRRQWDGGTPATDYRSDTEGFWSGLDLSNMDLYAMAAFRHQVHFFNDNDTCCYQSAKLTAMDYETPISNLVTPYGGTFEVIGINGAAQHYPMIGDSGVAAVNNRILTDLVSL